MLDSMLMRRCLWGLASSFLPLAALAVNTTINGALGDLDGNGDGGTAEAAIVQAAANCWDARITTNRNFTVAVSAASLTGRGVGATTGLNGNVPNAGFITMDNDGSVAWFVDPSPLASLEFTPDPNSQWRFINGAGNAAQADLLRSVMHEFGHAHGWICGNASCGGGNNNPNYDALMNPAAGSPILNTVVNLQNVGGVNVPLRGDGLAGGVGVGGVVNELSHHGPPGGQNAVADMMFGRTGNGIRETHSVNDVNMFAAAYGDAVNLPPTISAGVDQVAECDAPGGASVVLDASGSTDPEADALTYGWTCPAALLSNANSAMANAFVGVNQMVTCRVDATDLAACPADADTVNVTVVDTTDPMLTVPTDTGAECSAPTGTPVDIGTANANDICDATVSITNNAPAVFPLGATVVDWTAIDDSGNQDTGMQTVNIVDTTVPMITAPPDVVAECTAPAGTPVDIGMAVATDSCDASLSLSNDAPALFPLGQTVVTWTATDDSLNENMASHTVEIVDTTPPEFELTVSPDVLWPPNHKLVNITATITMLSDTCDPNPMVRLVSIVSNEPDNGIGDGNTANDVQDASFGTDDRTFRLRAERAGGGGGREYTITYSVTDASGNEATRQATVRVPESMGST